MAENPSLFQLTQIGVESTAGTGVAATKKFSGLSIEAGFNPETKFYRPAGYRFPTTSVLSKEWTEASLQGPLTYNEILYPLNSLIKKVTPTGTTAKTWVFSPTTTGSDTRQTYTVENGSSTWARKFVYGLVTGMTFEFGREELTVGGTMIGKAITDNQTLSAGTTELSLLPVMPTQVQLYLADTAAGLAGAAALGRAFSGGFSFVDTAAPVFPLNASSTYAATVDTEPKGAGKLLVAIDSEGMAPLTNMRAGTTKFLRIKALGDLISGSDYNMFQVDMACRVQSVQKPQDEQGIYAIGWDFSLVHDATWGKAFEITVVNTVATL